MCNMKSICVRLACVCVCVFRVAKVVRSPLTRKQRSNLLFLPGEMLTEENRKLLPDTSYAFVRLGISDHKNPKKQYMKWLLNVTISTVRQKDKRRDGQKDSYHLGLLNYFLPLEMLFLTVSKTQDASADVRLQPQRSQHNITQEAHTHAFVHTHTHF